MFAVYGLLCLQRKRYVTLCKSMDDGGQTDDGQTEESGRENF